MQVYSVGTLPVQVPLLGQLHCQDSNKDRIKSEKVYLGWVGRWVWRWMA